MKNIRTVIIVSTLLVVVLVVAYLYIYRGSVHFILAPDTAEIVIDEGISRKAVRDNESIYLTPGEHSLTFYRNDFSIEHITVTISSFKSQEQLVALTPLNETAKEIMQTTKNQERLKTYSARKKNTIFSLLPIRSAEYSIESCDSLKPSPDTKNRALCLGEIATGGTEKAKQYLLGIGYDPSNYEVYTGDDTAVKIVYETDLYTVSYPTNEKLDKPMLVLLFKEPVPRPILPQKDAMLAGLAARGYNLEDYYLYFLNPELTRFSVLPAGTELFD
jgi:hypothetical protein